MTGLARWLTTTEVFAVPVGRLHHVVVDCPDPMAEARFWSAVLGNPITYADEDFVVVSAGTEASGLAFQRATDLMPPTWPESTVPQQMHLDVMVDDRDAAGEAVLALGARRLPGDHVYADPAGHPFCLIRRPTWAPSVN
jgi:catechol 2,3-dioxygenase-like lactoylglutathione lyase family enzyme